MFMFIIADLAIIDDHDSSAAVPVTV